MSSEVNQPKKHNLGYIMRISAVVNLFSRFIVYRMIGGVVVGLAGAVPPMHIAEFVPKDYCGTALSMNHMRAQKMAVAVAFLWFFNFVVSQSFPMMNEHPVLLEKFNGAFPMWVFAGCCIIGFFFILRYAPETKGVSLEKMEELMLSKQNQSKNS